MRGLISKVYSQPYHSVRSNAALRLIVKLHDESCYLVAHSLLPYEFIVKANGNGNHRIRPHRGARQQALRPVLNPLSASALEPKLPELSVDPYSQPNPTHIPPVLRRLSPADGPVTGGPIILISGINFPPPTQHIVYVRFGSVVVPTVRLVLVSQQKTDSIDSPGKTHTRSSVSYLLLQPQGQSR